MGTDLTPSVIQKIHSAITYKGKITFADFMELALYWPNGGYYSHTRPDNANRDFYTAPAAHPLFGALISVQLEQMWHILGCPSTFLLAEMGAGDGRLCKDILNFTAHQFPFFYETIDYVMLDRGRFEGSVIGQIENGGGAHFLKSSTVPFRGVVGCLLSNELVDSFPVHRVFMDGVNLKEIYVGLEDGSLVEITAEPSTPLLAQRLTDLNVTLPSGFRTEICLGLDTWSRNVSLALEKGYVMTIDYGYPATTLYGEERTEGTLRLYYRHTYGMDPYRLIGEQDMTAHVDFTSLIAAGQRNGLSNTGLRSQREMLLNLGLDYFLRALDTSGLNPVTLNANRMGILDLVRVGGMGEFGVLIQSKGAPTVPLHSFTRNNTWIKDIEQRYTQMEIPLLTRNHMPLMHGRYPHYSQEWNGIGTGRYSGIGPSISEAWLGGFES